MCVYLPNSCCRQNRTCPGKINRILSSRAADYFPSIRIMHHLRVSLARARLNVKYPGRAAHMFGKQQTWQFCGRPRNREFTYLSTTRRRVFIIISRWYSLCFRANAVTNLSVRNVIIYSARLPKPRILLSLIVYTNGYLNLSSRAASHDFPGFSETARPRTTRW